MINAEKGAHFATIVVAATVLDLAIPVGLVPVRATLSLETAQIRYRYDGKAPTSTVGCLLEIGQQMVIDGSANVGAFLAIRTGGTSGALPIHYERENA